jgi:hypothetical protein
MCVFVGEYIEPHLHDKFRQWRIEYVTEAGLRRTEWFYPNKVLADYIRGREASWVDRSAVKKYLSFVDGAVSVSESRT